MKILKNIFILALLIIAFWLGYKFKTSSGKISSAIPAETSDRQVKDWTCSMHPQIRQQKAGNCPICGMDLIPVNVTAGGKAGKAELKLSDEAVKLAEIETVPVQRKFVSAEIMMLGKIAFNESTISTINARMPGRIDRLFVNYTGIAVKKGEHIAEVYSPDLLLAQQELIQALNLLKTSKPGDEFAARTLNSVKEKYRLWGFSEEQVQEIINRGKVADRLTITAPMSGIVTEKDVLEGVYYEKGAKLFTIADLSKVWVNLEAYETDIPWIKYGQDVEFTTEAYPGKTFKGTIAFIQPVMNESTRTVKVRLNADNHDGMLKPGMFVRATLHAKIAANGKVIDTSLAGKWISPMHPEIIKDGPGSCDICGMALVPAESLGFADPDDKKLAPPLVIPASAPLITGKRALVYVAAPGKTGIYEGREIRLGPLAGAYYIVESGLKEGDNVVTKGNFKIDSSLQIEAKPSMMTPAPENTVLPSTGITEAVEKPHTGSGDLAKDRLDRKAPPPPDDIMTSYFAVHKALFLDSLPNAVKQASKIDERYSSRLSSSKDLQTARENFSQISALLYKELNASAENLKKPAYRFFCPMAFNDKGAYWLQDNKQIQNPYFGSVMPKCGELKETISAENRQLDK
ncbi:MAG: efflux RND transporter periplasmic adaptor subunit [Victivallales bacterium]|jgi:Cu(I)/Ag(I) efflux system membrane fusion protein